MGATEVIATVKVFYASSFHFASESKHGLKCFLVNGAVPFYAIFCFLIELNEIQPFFFQAELGKPNSSYPDKGKVSIYVDCSPTAEPTFEVTNILFFYVYECGCECVFVG